MAERSNIPTDGMKSAARRALEWKKEGKRGGTGIGLARANQIVNGVNLSDSTVKRMYSFFSRHEVDKRATGFSSGEEGFPSPGRVAWDLWGGDAGFSWSRKKVASMKKSLEKGGSVGSFVTWNSSGGSAYGKILRIVRNGKVNVPNSSFEITGTPEDPAALIRVYREVDGKWTPTDTVVGHKLSTLKPAKMSKSMHELMSDDEYDDMEEPEDEYEGMSSRQMELYESLEEIANEYGPFNRGVGPDGIHYMEENPFNDQGMNCGNCVFFEEGMCELLAEGDNSVASSAVCKFWIIPEDKLMEKKMDAFELEKRDYNSKQRRQMAGRGQAMPDGSYPIANEQDLRNAIQAFGRAKNPNSVKRHIITRARALGLTELLPEEWKTKKNISNGFTGIFLPEQTVIIVSIGSIYMEL